MNIPVLKTPAFRHFKRRVFERIGGGVNARALWDDIIQAIEEDREDYIRFVCRIKGKGRRVYKMNVKGKVTFVVFDHQFNMPITILDEGFMVRRRKPNRSRELKS